MKTNKRIPRFIRHCEERSDEAISKPLACMQRDRITTLALTASTHKSAIPRKHMLAEMALALGLTALAQPASAAVVTFDWTGVLTMLDPNGDVLANTSITTKGANQYHTPISGTLELDTTSVTGLLNAQPFMFFSNPYPMWMNDASLESAGGNLLLLNMRAAWGFNGLPMPISSVLDASGLFAVLSSSLYVGATISGVGVRPAADGTYVGGSGTHINGGYLDLGTVPIATTKWNTTPTCAPGGGNSGACLYETHSGSLPLIADTATNLHDFNAPFMSGDGSNDPGIGGSPMPAGPFESYSMNFDFTSLTVTSVTAVPVPVPAAAWLLGSGLVGLIGVALRKRCR